MRSFPACFPVPSNQVIFVMSVDMRDNHILLCQWYLEIRVKYYAQTNSNIKGTVVTGSYVTTWWHDWQHDDMIDVMTWRHYICCVTGPSWVESTLALQVDSPYKGSVMQAFMFCCFYVSLKTNWTMELLVIWVSWCLFDINLSNDKSNSISLK